MKTAMWVKLKNNETKNIQTRIVFFIGTINITVQILLKFRLSNNFPVRS
jgi:hypothetical protein